MDFLRLFLRHRAEGRSGEPDPSSQARVPAVRPRKDRRWRFRCSSAEGAAAVYTDPVSPAVPQDRSASRIKLTGATPRTQTSHLLQSVFPKSKMKTQ